MFKLGSADGMAILLVGIASALVGVVAVAAIVMRAWERLRRLRIEADLTRRMIERGMSAEEIALVLRAGRDVAATEAAVATKS